MPATLLSVLVPLYNEEEFVAPLIERVLQAPLPDGMEREIIVVDDGSRDGSAEIVAELAARHPEVRLVRHERNRGKGAAICTAIELARGDYSIIQDADLEYDPREYVNLLRPLLEGKADVVYGSRFMIVGERRVLYFWHSVANKLLTEFCNLVSDLNLTDMETCYKIFRTSLLKSIPIRSERFGIEPELTIKVARRQVRIYETPISYHGRTYEEGKKIGLKDAIEALCVILRYAFTNDIYKDSGPDILHALSKAPRFNRWMAETIRPYVGEQGARDRRGNRQSDARAVAAREVLCGDRYRSGAYGALSYAVPAPPQSARPPLRFIECGGFRRYGGEHGHRGLPERARAH